MSKLTLEALKQRANVVASEELLNSISGGTENSCHDGGSSSSAATDAFHGLWESYPTMGF